MHFKEKYYDNLNNWPAQGQGRHCHKLRVANFGRLAGLSPEQVFLDIQRTIPKGGRNLDHGIIVAIKESLSGTSLNFQPKQQPVMLDGKAKLADIIGKSKISDEADLWEDSPVRLDWPPEEDTCRFLQAMFHPEDLIFIGAREATGVMGATIRTRDGWVDYFKSGGQTAPFLIINPLDGLPKPKKSGEGVTYRSDDNVSEFRYCMAEFDNLTWEEQIRFWTSSTVRKLGIVALVDTAGKSIHGWIKTPNIETIGDWRREIKGKLYDQALIPMGVDSACSNPSRLSRLPGHVRDGRYQRILWLNSNSEVQS